MKIAIAQINTVVGDVEGNADRIRAAHGVAMDKRADLVVFPELAVAGYPPRDLIYQHGFVDRNLAAIESLAKDLSSRAPLVVGYVGRHRGPTGRKATNAVAFLAEGRILQTREKTLLPSYDVFDEDRYFQPAAANEPIAWKSTKLGLTICEDIWNDKDLWPRPRYPVDPAMALIDKGARVIVNASASPWHLGKDETRVGMLRNLAVKGRAWVVYCNLVGGNDELIFDGRGMAFDPDGRLAVEARQFGEDLVVVDTEASTPIPLQTKDPVAQAHDGLVLGLGDYMKKCGFRSAVLGLSGGIDSAVTAVLAARALGPDNVRGFALPSPYSSQGSVEDARALASRLGVRCDTLPIHAPFDAIKRELAPVFAGRDEDVTEENMQARVRGVMLMAVSNKFGALLLTTGNKSELAVGYCTLYGDMCGGLAVISDVPKTLVYRLARWINRSEEIIPANTLTKPPSAELRPDQTDLDSLPDYETLDRILDAYVARRKSAEEIVASGAPKDAVEKVIRLIEINEYKRRQAAPGLKITGKAFGVGRRMPIARGFC